MSEENELVEKYKARLQRELGEVDPCIVQSKDYADFKKEIMPARFGWYEKLVHLFGFINIPSF